MDIDVDLSFGVHASVWLGQNDDIVLVEGYAIDEVLNVLETFDASIDTTFIVNDGSDYKIIIENTRKDFKTLSFSQGNDHIIIEKENIKELVNILYKIKEITSSFSFSPIPL